MTSDTLTEPTPLTSLKAASTDEVQAPHVMPSMSTVVVAYEDFLLASSVDMTVASNPFSSILEKSHEKVTVGSSHATVLLGFQNEE